MAETITAISDWPPRWVRDAWGVPTLEVAVAVAFTVDARVSCRYGHFYFTGGDGRCLGCGEPLSPRDIGHCGVFLDPEKQA